MAMPRGFSLLELLLSMALGLLLCALFLPVLQATLHSQRFALGQLDAQQEARFVLQQLGWDLRMAGSLAAPDPHSGRQRMARPCHKWGHNIRVGLCRCRGGCPVETDPTGQPGLRCCKHHHRGPPGRCCCQLPSSWLILGEQAWLQAQEDTVWLRLAHDSPAWQNLNRHHLLSLELQPCDSTATIGMRRRAVAATRWWHGAVAGVAWPDCIAGHAADILPGRAASMVVDGEAGHA
jgi:prepilin-type N-terminal cleavage/methylation domain-containing protein